MAQSQPRRATWRMGARERLRLQGVFVVLICILLFFVVFRPWIRGVIDRRDLQTCQTNVLKIARAITTYSQDYDGTLPNGESWTVAARGSMAATSGTGFRIETYFHCPLDKSGQPASYAYNDLFSGLSLEVRSGDSEHEARRRQIGRLDRAPLVIEKFGQPLDAHLPLPDWDAVLREMTRLHPVPQPTGHLITGRGAVVQRNEEQLSSFRGKRF